MVYLHFPSNLTEEELMLQAKYQKLKKKKKALLALKAPKPEPEKPVLPKRPTEARDAREIARKLLKSGAIQAIKSPPPLPQNATFKRPRAGRERKLSGTGVGVASAGGGGVASYQPFSASQESPIPEERAPPRVKNLYDSFVSARDKEERSREGAEAAGKPKAPSCTVFVSAPRLTEELIRQAVTPYGTLLSIVFEPEKSKGYATFDRAEIAHRVIAALDGTTLEATGATLRVGAARRPPADAAWGALAAHGAPKAGPREPKRQAVVYDDMFEP